MRVRLLLLGLGLFMLIGFVTDRIVQSLAADGPVIFAISLHMAPGSATLDPQSGKLFVMNRPFGFYGYGGGYGRYDESTGAGRGGGGLYGSAGYVATAGTIRARNVLNVINTNTGAVEQALALRDVPVATALDSQHELLYTAASDGTVSVMDARDGALLHSEKVGAFPRALGLDVPAGRVFVVSADNSTVHVLDSRLTRVLRVVHIPATGYSFSMAVDSMSSRVIISAGSFIEMLDARSGALLHTISLTGDSASSFGRFGASRLAVDEKAGRAYVLDGRSIKEVDASSGRLLRSFSVGEYASAMAVDPRNGHLLLVSSGHSNYYGPIQGKGSLRVLNPDTGAVLRTISLGLAPTSIVVDEHADHVVVLDRGGQQQQSDPWGWVPGGLRQHLPFLPDLSQQTSLQPAKVLILDLRHI